MRTGTTQLYSEGHDLHQEAAIMFAAGFTDAAIALLEAADEKDFPRAAWLVLLDLYRAVDRKLDFHRALGKYRKAFPGMTAPDWAPPAPIDAPGTLPLAGTLDGASEDVALIQRHAAGRGAFALDMSQVNRIAFSFLGELAGLFRGYHLQGKRVILANISELHATLLEAVGVPAVYMRRKPSLVALNPVALAA